MGADFYLDVPCAVRKEMSNDEIITCKKNVFVLRNIMSDNPEVTDDFVVKGTRIVGQQRTEYNMTVGDFKSILARYVNFRDKHCSNCKYNILDDAMGCMGRINYPIPMKNELFIFSTIIDNLQVIGEMKDPFIRSLVNDYPSQLSTKAIAMYRMRGMMFQNRMPIQTSSDVSKSLISSDFIWASYLLPHDSDLPFGKEQSGSDVILIEYSTNTLGRHYNHAKLMEKELEKKLMDPETHSDANALIELHRMQKFYKFIQYAHEDKLKLYMAP